MQDFVYNGCVMAVDATGSGLPDVLLPNATVTADPEHPYVKRLVARGILATTQIISCVPQASAWSKPITWDMVNHPNSGGSISVDLGAVNYGIDLNTITNVQDFFADLKQQCNAGDVRWVGFTLETRTNADGSVSVRYLPSVTDGNTESLQLPTQTGQFYTYSPQNVGNMGETVIHLADAFDTPPFVMNCIIPQPQGV